MIKRWMLLAGVAILFIGITDIDSMTDTAKVKDIYEFEIFRSGSVMPKGWILEQLSRDLTEGYAGRYDQVHPTVANNVFVNQDRISKRKIGLRKEWWSGEHEGYWKDGVIRMAFLTGNKTYIDKAKAWIDEIISHSGEEGYIGIYADCEKPGCRFNHTRGNGELWATSRIVMALLAYYEFTGDRQVLDAAEKAVKLIIKNYSSNSYFATESKGGGVSHGVGFFENLEWLYRITGKPEYVEFAVKLYRDFNAGNFRDDDLKTGHLLNESRLFQKHGAHIAEGLFVPELIAAIERDEVYREAAANVIPKLEKHLTPGGAMRCDEWIKGRVGTADERYEYCGIAEMVSPLNKMISFTGNLSLADHIETMTFNAGQGARFPVLTALSYFTRDNRIKINHREIIKREHYDAAHLAAVCCALNGIRLMPYYVEGMWMKGKDAGSLVAALFGPCELNTSIEGIPVNIKEITDYPFSDSITFSIHAAEEVSFPLIIRKPFGCRISKLEIPDSASVTEYDHWLQISGRWKGKNEVRVVFAFDIMQVPQPASKTVKREGAYLRRGPLVYALPFKHRIDTIKEYRNSGFYRHRIRSSSPDSWKYSLHPEDAFEFLRLDGNSEKYPWDEPVVELRGVLRNNKNEKKNVSLVPMGNTILRRVTFSLTDTN